MDAEQFRERGKAMIDYVADYIKNIRTRDPLPATDAGYMRMLVPDQAPSDPDQWEDVIADIERVIMPGVCHWQHPNFHAYFPAGNSFESTLADILGDSIGAISFSWASCPASTELEMIVTDWLAKMFHLPEHFLHSSDTPGGGCIQHTASESTFFALLTTRAREIRKLKRDFPEADSNVCLSKFVAYCSEEVCATLGTTSSCAFDNVQEIGEICAKEELWLHIDAAYAGSAFICPEYRPLLNGVEFADSFSFNPHKWMKVYFDCSVMWVRDRSLFTEPFKDQALYINHDNRKGMPDFRNWSIPQGRRFRSLKLWFVLRMFGVTGLQEGIRKDVQLALYFESLVNADTRFETFKKASMGLVCFRLKATNSDNAKLLTAINTDRRIHLVPSSVKGIYFLRFVIGVGCNEQKDIDKAWSVINEVTENLRA